METMWKSDVLEAFPSCLSMAVAQPDWIPDWASNPALTGDYDFMIQMASAWWQNVQFASEELRGNSDFMMEVVFGHPFLTYEEALVHASDDLKGDRSFFMELVSRSRLALRYAPASLRADPEVMMKAVSNDGEALEHASEDLKADMKIVMSAVSKHGRALQYASEDLRANREVVMTAVSENPVALNFVSGELSSDISILDSIRWESVSSHLFFKVSLMSGRCCAVVVESTGLRFMSDERVMQYVLELAARHLGLDEEEVLRSGTLIDISDGQCIDSLDGLQTGMLHEVSLILSETERVAATSKKFLSSL